MSEEYLKIGNIVDVYWEQVPCLFDVEIISMPRSDEDSSYTVKDEKGQLHYVKNYGRMSRRFNSREEQKIENDRLGF